MAAQNPTASVSEKPFGISQIKAYVPIILDMKKLNYDAWNELFETHCISFSVLGHLDATSTPTAATEIQWKKCDGLVKMWIYGTISESLLDKVLKKKCTARELWLTIEFENELCTITIGDLRFQ